MNVDLFTWVAQIVNFLILMGLLRHFLYGRILRAIDQREQRIAERWHAAEEERDKASRQGESYAAQREELERKRSDILARAKEEAERQKQQWLQEARAEVDHDRDNWQKALKQQQQSFLEELRRTAAAEITRTVRRLLQEMADEDLEQRTLRQFTRQLARADEQRQPLRDFLAGAGQTVIVNTAFGLSQEQQQDLRRTLQEAAGEELDVQFGTSRDLLSGIELRADGRKLAWSIQDYLEGLGERVRRILEERIGGQKAAVPGQAARETNANG